VTPAEEEVAYRFPEGFLWGAATAAHQVEGGNDQNDWWAWEEEGGHIRDGSASGRACEHWTRFPEDFETLHRMGHNAHRLSIEWSRIEPRPGEIDAAAVAHYREVLETLRRLGIEPLVTLHHFTNPRWFVRGGGWEEPFSIAAFAAFARLCAREYGDLVTRWTTFNEPNVFTYQGWFNGYWPPQKRDFGLGVRVFRHLLQAHAAAYREIKAAPHGAAASVGVAQHLRVFEPWRRWSPLDAAAAALPDAAFNHWFLRGCTDGSAGFPLGTTGRVPEAAGTLDWIGVNYYSRDMVAFDPKRPNDLFSRTFPRPGGELSDYQMEIWPEGLHTLLLRVWERYRKPICITENGVADATDALRPRALVGHLAETARALREGVDLFGYLHWSTMDNFEWAEGYTMRFGLLEVDFETQARTPRPSAALYSRVIARGGLTWEELQEHHPRGLRYFVGAESEGTRG
jgi:beta-glucosidase